MSDIPDWLVELAAQRDDNEEEDAAPLEAEELETIPDDVQEEWDFLRAAPSAAEETSTASLDSAPAVSLPLAPGEEADEGEVIDVLRGQAEAAAVAAEALEAAPKSASGRRIAGLLPWQQAVLAILLLLDIVVIGFLFLVILGRIAIG
ncbi:MAG: hypothetical protein MUF84_10895 [Anaerolineae bacterium]|jgi:hypothetical protein|nr:hypothetical protein [Anaerolineae bacterium]